MEKNK